MICFVLTPRSFAYRHAANTFYQLQMGLEGRRHHVRIQEFLSVLFSPQLILQFTEGVQWFYCWENYTYTLPRIQRGFISFQGDVSSFFQGGPNANFYRSLYTYLLFSRGCPDPLSPSGSAHGQCHHNGTIFITVPLLTMIVRHWFVRINDRWVFQMVHWYCTRLAPSRNTALGSGSILQFSFFWTKYPLPQCSESNNIGDWLIQSKNDGKDQESIQSSTTPDPGYQWESNKLTVRYHKRELRGQDNLQIYYSSASATVLSKGTELRWNNAFG